IAAAQVVRRHAAPILLLRLVALTTVGALDEPAGEEIWTMPRSAAAELPALTLGQCPEFARNDRRHRIGSRDPLAFWKGTLATFLPDLAIPCSAPDQIALVDRVVHDRPDSALRPGAARRGWDPSLVHGIDDGEIAQTPMGVGIEDPSHDLGFSRVDDEHHTLAPSLPAPFLERRQATIRMLDRPPVAVRWPTP